MVSVEKLEKNMAKLTVEVSAETFDQAIQTAFNKNKKNYNIPGFRKGKAPIHMVAHYYGGYGIFYNDAIDEVLPDSYEAACKESGLEIVSRPEIGIEKVEKGQGLTYTATVAVKPEVTLGQYKGVEVPAVSAEVTDADVEAELKSVQAQNARKVTADRAVADGDKITLDFEGFVDGQGFEGGKAEDYELVIGSHSFIDTFEVQLIGKQIGEECEVNVTFPADYHAAELAGKPAMFKVTVKSIEVLPELNDEFADEVSDFETLAEYKESLKTKLAPEKEKEAKEARENAVVEAVVAGASMEIPDAMIETQVNDMIQDYANRMQQNGLSLSQYMEYTGMTMDSLRASAREQAEKTIRTRLVLEAVVKAENLEISEERMDEEFKSMAERYSSDKNTVTVEQLKEMYTGEILEQMKQNLLVQDAITFLTDNASFQ